MLVSSSELDLMLAVGSSASTSACMSVFVFSVFILANPGYVVSYHLFWKTLGSLPQSRKPM